MSLASFLSPYIGTQKTSLEDDHRIGGLGRLSVHLHEPFYFTGYEAKA